MRRGLATASLLLVLLGIELSTGTLSLMATRFVAGFRALGADTPFHVSSVRFGSGVLALGSGLALCLLLLWAAGMGETVASVGNGCPDCGHKTRRVKRKGWHRMLSVLLGKRLTKRQCENCGWNGLSQGL